MIYSKRHRLNGVKPIDAIATHTLPMVPSSIYRDGWLVSEKVLVTNQVNPKNNGVYGLSGQCLTFDNGVLTWQTIPTTHNGYY